MILKYAFDKKNYIVCKAKYVFIRTYKKIGGNCDTS